MLSENMRFAHYNIIAKEIQKEIKSGTNGIIITHGTDTLHYTASALSFMLEGSDKALLLPPGIWSHQIPREDNTIFGVWCDRPYEEEDYIRDWDEFISTRTVKL